MIGAIIGDIAGSVYEFNNVRRKDVALFPEDATFTDDTILTIAVSKALSVSYNDDGEIDHSLFHNIIVDMLREYGKKYFQKGYGGRFKRWLQQPIPFPYNSYGNGSAMRVSSVGWVADTLEETLELAEKSADVTHNHPEGIKGAQAVASAIFLLRNGSTKEEVKQYIESRFEYKLNRTIDNIRETNKFYESCQRSVPEAIMCFLQGVDFEDVIRNAISIGGDSDTIAAIAGSIAEAIYPIPEEMMMKAREIVREQFDRRDFAFYDKCIRPKKIKLGLSSEREMSFLSPLWWTTPEEE